MTVEREQYYGQWRISDIINGYLVTSTDEQLVAEIRDLLRVVEKKCALISDPDDREYFHRGIEIAVDRCIRKQYYWWRQRKKSLS